MSIEENKALIRRIYEEMNRQNWAGIEELHAPDAVFHGMPPGISPGLAGAKQLLTPFWTAFPDAHWAVDDLIAEGDKVVARLTFRGAHQGEFMGIPPTGKVVTVTAIAIYRCAGGKGVEHWWNRDDLGLMQQVGAIPQMAQTGA